MINFSNKLMQTIYDEASKRLYWGSCVKTGIAVLERMGCNAEWIKSYKSNVDKITQELMKRFSYVHSDIAAQNWANNSDGSYIVIATLVRYDNLEKKKGGNHHFAFVLPSDRIHHFPKIGGGGVRDEKHILSDARIHFWYNPKNKDYMTYVRYPI